METILHEVPTPNGYGYVRVNKMCRCGCESESVYLVTSTDYDGTDFQEGCCDQVTDYLEECAADGGMRFSKERLAL